MSLESLANLSNDQGLEKGEWEVLHHVCRRGTRSRRGLRDTSSQRKIIKLIVANSECEVDST